MRSEYWILKAINALSEYVIITPFTRLPWLHECASMLFHTYIVCTLVTYLHAKLGSKTGLSLSTFRTTILRAFFIFPMCTSCPVHFSLVHSISLVIYDERYDHRCSLLRTNNAPHYEGTVLFLTTYESRYSSLCTNSAAPHYVQSPLLLIMYEKCCYS
jgi:hypothetical protein